MIQIFDNLLTPEEENKIEEFALNQKYNKFNNIRYLDQNISSIPSFPQETTFGDYISPSLQPYLRKILKKTNNKSKLNFGNAIRWKINKLSPLKNKIDTKWGIHIDDYTPHYSLIYYINNVDGDTIFYNNTLGDKLKKWERFVEEGNFNYWEKTISVSPKKGRIVVFNGEIFHHSNYPTSKDRYIINFNIKLNSKNSNLI